VLAREPSSRPGRYCIRLSWGLGQGGQLAEVAFGQVGQGPFQVMTTLP
jgi:hypothetical protein